MYWERFFIVVLLMMTHSDVRSSILRSVPWAYPSTLPSLRTTRWQGVLGISGFAPQIRPITRGQVHNFCAKILYVVTFHNGILFISL